MSEKRKKPKTRPERCCFSCRHWDGRVKVWQDVGDTSGACLWLVNLAATHASMGIPNWVAEARPVRGTYDDDGEDCPAWEGRLALQSQALEERS